MTEEKGVRVKLGSSINATQRDKSVVLLSKLLGFPWLIIGLATNDVIACGRES